MANFAAIMAILLILGTLCTAPAADKDSEGGDSTPQDKK